MFKLRPHIHSGERTRTLLLLAAPRPLHRPSSPLHTPAPALLPWSSRYEEEEELEGRAPTDVELTPGVEAAFTRESYAPRSTAELVGLQPARGPRLQILHTGPEGTRTRDQITMNGVPVTKPVAVGHELPAAGRSGLGSATGRAASTSRG